MRSCSDNRRNYALALMFASVTENADVANQSSDIYSNKTRVIDESNVADMTHDVDSRRHPRSAHA